MAEEVRKDFREFADRLATTPSTRVGVTFGFAWGSEIYEGKWQELSLTGEELSEMVARAEASGAGRIGADDLFISIPSLGAIRTYCHEADIHVVATDPDNQYIAAEKNSWEERGWEVIPYTERQ